MHNVFLIARREYLERIRTRGFLLATVLIPVLMGTLIFGSVLLMSSSKTQSHVAVVSENKLLAEDMKQQLESGRDAAMKVDLYAPSDAVRSQLNTALHAKDSSLAGYLWITPGATAEARPNVAYAARSAGDIATAQALESALHSVLMRERLEAHGLSTKDIDDLNAPVKMDTSASGDSGAAFLAAYMMFFLMYMVIMLYGMNTARSIIDEKTSRIFEVLLATISPEELLAGKILGVGAVGLTQVSVWMLAVAAFAGSGLAPALAVHGHAVISFAQIGFFILYFLFGFLIYSAVAAALGAMTNSEQELQQLNMFLLIPMLFCMVMIFPIMRAPDSTLARVVSLIPFCSPLLMNFRLSLTHVQSWEVWLSVALMTATIAAILTFSARIYRVGILMYGKKPNLPEMMRWLRYS